LDIDNQYPYRVYGTQQDNTSISVPSASEWGVITLADCSYPGTGESGFIAVHPQDHNIVYVGAIGSSPGGAGALQRYDHRTRQLHLVNVWPEESTGIAPEDLKYRFAWTYPIVFSPHDPNTIYVGATRYKLSDYKPYLFKSSDGGKSWISINGNLPKDEISRVVRADAVAKGLLFVGTETGIHFSLDDGRTWTRMTGLPNVP